uniref:Metal-nicotianamine transporter YSL7 n=1 Tax=Lactuca sativa TaxID=4236 RepID=A0A9R1US36_LACSA|nr:hypothetical protein LSAT_V11C800435710 [Lactuca sativa]
MLLGDGLYNFVKVLSHTLFGLYHRFKDHRFNRDTPIIGNSPRPPLPIIRRPKRARLFLKDQILVWIAITGYLTIAIYIATIYIFAPALTFCIAYGYGLTDWSLASTYGKLAIFVIGAWVGGKNGGVLAGLVACGVMMNIFATASDLMQDFKTGYMTLASPRSMLVSQVVGTAMGCVISPCYPAPYALVYRNMSILRVEGFSALPSWCLMLCYIFFVFVIFVNGIRNSLGNNWARFIPIPMAIFFNGIRDSLGNNWARFIPIPMAMAISFYIGGHLAIDMCVGSFRAKAVAFGPQWLRGLICGNGIWSLDTPEFDSCFGGFKCFSIWTRDLDVIEYGNVFSNKSFIFSHDSASIGWVFVVFYGVTCKSD